MLNGDKYSRFPLDINLGQSFANQDDDMETSIHKNGDFWPIE